VINEGLKTVKLPDEKTEIQLNEQNTGRWKSVFDDLKNRSSNLEGDEFVKEVRRLGDLNRKNTSIENIYFEASKFISKKDKNAALTLYIYYLHYDLRSVSFDNKKLTKTIQKNLFANNTELHEFERIVSDLISSRDTAKALSSVSGFYTPKRKIIKLSGQAIQDAREKHSGTVETLNEYLHDEFEDDENAIISKEAGENELNIEITQKTFSESEHIASPAAVELKSSQFSLLRLFASNSFVLTHVEVETLAKENGAFRNQLIDSINEACFEMLDDVLIEEEDETYIVDNDYYQNLFPQ